ncbi:uncharacterized protein LOC114354261, partial [Ostrinia furnacalis]|uniref:uncharacterized protein LOC114354261 n=1 Tax=Ostrinia furnacalis TaxID=93504 RepID=UPI00103F52E5
TANPLVCNGRNKEARALRCAADTQEAPQRFAAEVAAAALRAPRYWARESAQALNQAVVEIITTEARALRCAADTQEAPQRFAAEVAAAALRAPRYWARESAQALNQAVVEIITTETSTANPLVCNGHNKEARALRCAADTQKAPQRFAAEVAAAALRAPRYWARESAQALNQAVVEIITTVHDCSGTSTANPLVCNGHNKDARAIRCAADTQEAPQRFAAEVAAAALRAPRYWARESAQALNQAVVEIITTDARALRCAADTQEAPQRFAAEVAAAALRAPRYWARESAQALNQAVVVAPAKDQVFSFDLTPEEMEEGERYLYEFFSDDANIDRLVAFLTIEEKKGRDKFSGIRFSMFRMMFAQFGWDVTKKYVTHALRCAADTQEAPQRFAAEVAAAALRAPRYWARESAQALNQAVVEIITTGLTTVIPETMEDWGTALATGVEKLDPNRSAVVLRALMGLCAPPAHENAQPDSDASFLVCARLYALQGALGSLCWRTAPLSAELLTKLEAANFTHHPYQNVRETVGSTLMTIFDNELVFPGGESGPSPRLQDFLDTVPPRLTALYDENGDIVVKLTASMGAGESVPREVPAAVPAPEPAPLPAHAAPLAVHVARLSPDHPIADDAPQVTD